MSMDVRKKFESIGCSYVSRTSVMLLPWAGLGWIVGFTIRAAVRRDWADPAAIALIVLTVGAVNATALAFLPNTRAAKAG